MAAARTAWRSLPDFLQTAADRVMPVLRSLAHAAIDTVFPPACLNCRQSTGAAHSLCASCWAQVRFIERPFCERLGTPFAMDLGNDGLLSPEAVANPPVYNRARAVAHFEDGPVRQLGASVEIQRQNGTCQTARAWMARAGNELWSRPIFSCRFPSTAAALPRADSIRRTPSRKLSPPNVASRRILSSSGGSSRLHPRLVFRVRSGLSIYRARFA